MVKRDLAGMIFGRLYVVGKSDQRQHRRVVWECICECGATAYVPTGSLTSGNTASCGCRQRKGKPKHSMHGTPEYNSWCQMRYRCYRQSRPDFRHYGGRGIVVCDRWRESFQAFFDDMGRRPSPRHSLDRIDCDGDYCPSNCRWSTQREQTRNQRRTHWITYGGQTKCMADWAEERGMSYTKLRRRLNLGWSAERALTE